MAEPRRRTLLELAPPGAELVGDPSTVVTGLGYDSRSIASGDLFVALRGDYFDGHSFIPHAIDGGAVALLTEEAPTAAIPAIVVRDSRAALPRLASTFYNAPSRELAVVGVTGTDGKTTTSYLIDAILRNADHQTGMIGTVSVRVGEHTVDHETRQTTPESLDVQRYLRRMVDAGCEWAVIEATSHGLDLYRLDEVAFDIGAVTNITHEHLEHHKTIAAYRRAKAILFERVAAAGGAAVINLDDEGAREMLPYAKGASILTYGVASRDADLRATNVELDVSGSSFVLSTPAGEALVRTSLLGDFNVANALCAAGVALAAGVPLACIVHSLERPPTVPGRMVSVNAGQPFAVVVDYAHTPESLAKVLALLRGLNPGGRLIAVFGSAGERDRTKRPLQGEVGARLADVTIVTTEDPRYEDADAIIDEIAAGALAAGSVDGVNLYRVTDRADAIRRAFSIAKSGDTILLAGKGHEQSIIWGSEKRPWDELSVARGLLAEMGYGAVQ